MFINILQLYSILLLGSFFDIYGVGNQDFFHGTKLFFDFINDYYYLTTLVHFLFATLYEHLFTTFHEHSDGTKLFLASPLRIYYLQLYVNILMEQSCFFSSPLRVYYLQLYSQLFMNILMEQSCFFLSPLRVNILQLYSSF